MPEETGWVLCDKHGHYWWEDGCASCYAEAEAILSQVVANQGHHVVCVRHGVKYWSEDYCPKCDAEAGQ